jgi:competence protein ComEA
MNVITHNLRRVMGLDDSETEDLFSGKSQHSRIRVKLAVGTATIAGLAILIITIIASSLSSVGRTVEIPQDLTASPMMVSEQDSTVLGTVLIHVIGEVNNPGIYELNSGSRVIDAVMSAGGLLSTAAECGVNLAREVKDGEQLSIPSKDQNCNVNGSSDQGGTLSLNSATAEQFDSLPGIGPTLAERIVQWRNSNSGFASVDQLNEVSGIGDKLFAGIRDLVTL